MNSIHGSETRREPPSWVELAISDIAHFGGAGDYGAVSERQARELLGMWGNRDKLSDEEFAAVIAWYAETYMVVTARVVGDPDHGYETAYGSDGKQLPTKAAAIAHGWQLHDSDDWLILRLVSGQAVRLSWMEHERDDLEELFEVARSLSLDLAPTAGEQAGGDPQ